MANNGMLFGPNFWRSAGVLSYIVGLVCYALSLSFKSLFGEWNPTKIVVYAILSLPIGIVVLFAGKCSVSDGLMPKLKPHVEFVIIMLTSLYSFFADQSMKGKPDTLTVVSSGAFALTSLCLSRQIELGFQVGLFNFFLGCLTVQLMKIRLIFILVAAGFSYPLVILRSYPELFANSDAQEAPAEYQLSEILIYNGNNSTAAGNEGISEQILQRSSRIWSDSEPRSDVGDSSVQGETRIQMDDANIATAAQNEGISKQRSSSSLSDSDSQSEIGFFSDEGEMRSPVDDENSETATQVPAWIAFRSGGETLRRRKPHPSRRAGDPPGSWSPSGKGEWSHFPTQGC